MAEMDTTERGKGNRSNQKSQRGDRKVESNDSPKTSSHIPVLPSGVSMLYNKIRHDAGVQFSE